MLLNLLSSISYTSPHTAVAGPVGDIGGKRGAKQYYCFSTLQYYCFSTPTTSWLQNCHRNLLYIIFLSIFSDPPPPPPPPPPPLQNPGSARVTTLFYTCLAVQTTTRPRRPRHSPTTDTKGSSDTGQPHEKSPEQKKGRGANWSVIQSM